MSCFVVGINKRNLKIGSGDIRGPGEEVPEANKWPAHVLRSHLNLKWLMTKEEYAVHSNARQAPVKAAKLPVGEEQKSNSPCPVETVLADNTPKAVKLNKDDLARLCKEKGLKVRGTKSQLIDRLKSAGVDVE